MDKLTLRKEKRKTPEEKLKVKLWGLEYRKSPKVKERTKNYNKKYRESKSGKTVSLKGHLKRNYDISINDYNILLEKQNNSCAICNKTQENLKERLAVDHCHNTGKIRGLLCKKCNLGIGNLNDDLNLVNKALEYLKLYNK